jgi:membrane protein
VALPALVAGPELVTTVAPAAAPLLAPLVWPLLAIALVVFVTTLYHQALPDRQRWRTGLPGALVAVWAAGSALLRVYLRAGQNGAGAGFGRLAATAAILLWLYISALAILVGAVFNAVRAGRPDPAGVVGLGKTVEPNGANGENKAETRQISSLRMTRSSA